MSNGGREPRHVAPPAINSPCGSSVLRFLKCRSVMDAQGADARCIMKLKILGIVIGIIIVIPILAWKWGLL